MNGANERRYYDALRRIGREYRTPDQLRKDARNMGMSAEEMFEMVYENLQTEAKNAIRGRQRPGGQRKHAKSTLKTAEGE